MKYGEVEINVVGVDSKEVEQVTKELIDKLEIKNINTKPKLNIREKIVETIVTEPIKALLGIVAGLILALLVWYFGFK